MFYNSRATIIFVLGKCLSCNPYASGWKLALTEKTGITLVGNMKFGLKKGWKSIVPLRLRGKSATRFCVFQKAKSASYGPGKAPVYLNVYDLTPMNGYVYWAGLGIFHSGVEGKLTYFS